MRKRWMLVLALVIAMVGAIAGRTLAHDGEKHGRMHARLSGFSEVPAVSTAAWGRFEGKVNPAGTAIDYTLWYMGAEGAVSAAHLHFGQTGVNGGVLAWLCGGGGKPACPATSGSVSGTIMAAHVLAAQGIAAGEFGEVLRAIKHRATYVNVHSSKFPDGELRGNVK